MYITGTKPNFHPRVKSNYTENEPEQENDVHPAKMGIRPVWSVFAGRLKNVWVLSYMYPQRTAKTLIRLAGGPGWSESSLGTCVISLVYRA